MYKTVRHGENSLQYTILPQTEEVLNNSGMKGKGRDYSPSIHIRRTRRRSTLKYVLMLVFGTVVALALAAVPLYVMNGALFTRQLQLRHDTTTPALTPGGREIIRSRKKELKILPVIVTLQPKREDDATTSTTVPSTISTTVLPATTSEKIPYQPWIIPALRTWKASASSTAVPQLPTEEINRVSFIGTPSDSVRLLDHYMSMKPWDKDIIIRPTVSPTPITFRNIFNYYTRAPLTSEKPVTEKRVFEDVLITTKAPTTKLVSTTDVTSTSEIYLLKDLKDTLLSVDDDDEFKESLEVDEVFSLPSVKPNADVPDSDSDEVTVSRTVDSKGSKWPFDTSAFLQAWSDRFFNPVSFANIVVPLLSALMSSLMVLLLLGFVVKFRRPTAELDALGKSSSDLQTDDNTKLLTAENPEEADE